ncbi:TonB-dependent receptor [Sphingobacterium sp. SGG-5]|uniref:TonB-dependent receptor n=1 Tax=Sphingobacterium sp. SGG-5 TaxID=2710881 RepID=UPI0013EB2549|nr:TonB-dependent receptor [Sphingobacterium sp. SGG-5]NGM60397.1 TonB-dependent receptor [Sphingobacterium sp. SGG-5]
MELGLISLRRIKCTVLILLVCMQTSIAAYSQRVTLNVRGSSLETILDNIQTQTGYLVLYNNEQVKNIGKIRLNIKNMELDATMKAVLNGLPLTYAIQGETILIKPSPSPRKESVQEKTQQETVSGRVVNESGQPLQGVSVSTTNGTNSTQTNEQGVFQLLNVTSNSRLRFSMLGYQRADYAISSLPSPVVLHQEVSNLDEIVVTGYGVQERRSITGAMSTVKGEDFENMPIQSLDKAIQGRAAGVLVQTSTGVPGGATRINIRGIGSISAGTEPMYIVDGVQLNSSAPSSRTSTNALAYINPNDIESIEILKDAAASAIYGAQAANGVILITTKQGKAGKPKLSLNYYEGISSPVKNMDVLSSQDAIRLRREALLNDNPSLSPTAALAQALVDLGVRPDLTEEEIAAYPTYDWQGEAFKTGRVRNIEFNTSGGNEKATYYLSSSYNKHDGNVTGIDFQRGNVKMRLNQTLTPRLQLDAGANLSLITQNGNTGSQGSTSGVAAPQYTASYMPPTVPIYNPDGSFNAYTGMPGTGFNPIQAATVDDNIVRQRSLIGNFSVSYKILDNLTFKSFYGIDYRFIRADYYRDPRTPNGATWNGYLIDDNTENVNFTTNQTLNYKKTINENHTITALLGAEYRSDVSEYESARANNFPTYEFRTNQSAADPYSVTGAWSGSRRVGFFGQANYNYKSKLFLSAVARYDGSSRFGVNNRFGFFPGISAGWDMAQERFLEGTSWVDQLKLRVGYGMVGNDQINNVSSRGFYQAGSRYNKIAALRLQTLANDDLGWETNVSTNIGLDFGLFKNRISGTVEAFHRNSRQLLISKPLPETSGFSAVDENLGRVVNQGLEIDLNTLNISTNGFQWRTNFNVAFLQNEVKELYDGLDFISNTIRVGHPLKIWYRARYAGVNSANGRPMWYDANGNITYLLSAEDNVETKKGWQSDYFGGLTNTFSYNGFDLSTLFHFDMGRYMANTMYQVWYNVMSNPGRNTLQELYDERWTTPGQITHVARPINGGAETNSSTRSSTTTQFLHDASFIRLREVTLGYQFPSPLLSKLKMERARVYLTTVNLHTWTKWVGYDPEFAVDGSVENNSGIVPQTMSFTAGIQVGF